MAFLDLVAQCMAVSPAETSTTVAQVQTLRCVLANQEMQRNMMAPPMMHSYALPPTSLPIASQPAAHNLGWNYEAAFTANPTSPVSINAQYAADALAMHPVATTNARPESDMDEPTVFLTNSHSMSTVSPAPKKKGERSAWTEEQVEALKVAVAMFEAENPDGTLSGKWKAIAENVPGRVHTQCRQRWEDSDKEERTKGTWSEDEDKALREALEAIEDTTWRRWTTVAEMVPRRTYAAPFDECLAV
ncbi:hypothetical protein SPRG_08687 [Saprolegnia parasitica CBS 223.65]|uniref:Myb-like domain-containing protein n=1 Tax=Saprolegnia parasitica (strain CBS 223.65) TaxID=695850 RepID=A0A067C5I5_SAPPC|nr:hypothetical protein SPRG_08687 [Saprolegnia parasitica CBS 223.65]KDO26034.1 hypothetical protein SPRG_08687 [Saprolegnia parasitica CBS 223.65]|eukprot:XP_012203320.1 hypothetical protein SPRG_08687 [Saprolegnia parasitica CBS 223.65]